jgi:hypothetical protein
MPDVNITSPNSINVIQFPPQNIPLYSVQEPELIMVARGGDTLAQQIGLAAGGAFVGAMPGACSAITQFSKDGKMDLSYLAALLISFAGLVLATVCWLVHCRQKTYPEQLLKSILSRNSSLSN